MPTAVEGAMRLMPVLGVWLWLGACVPDFPPASELGDAPRVLAVRLDPPEVSPGGWATVTPLLHAPGGDLHVTYLVCTADPLGASENCVADALEAGATLVPCGAAGQSVPVCVAEGDATGMIRVPAGFEPVIPGDDGLPVESLLHVELVVSSAASPLASCGDAVAAVAPGPDCLLAVKRLRVSRRAAPNRNPVIATFSVDGVVADATDWVPVSAPDADVADLEVALQVRLDPRSVDDAVDATGAPDETFLDVLWYVDCGTVDPDSGRIRCDPGAGPGDPPVCEPDAVTWRPGQSGECTAYAVVYDGRGGVGWWRQGVRIGAAP